MGLRRGYCRDQSELAVTPAPAKDPRVFFAIKSSGGVDRGRHLARLKLETLEFFGFQNLDYFGHRLRQNGSELEFRRELGIILLGGWNKCQTILRSAAAHQL